MEEYVEKVVVKGVTKVVKIIFIMTFMFVVGGLVTMSLWNWLMPEIFGLPVITWLQAFGLLILSRIFFGGWGGRNGKGKGKGKGKWKEGKWRKRWMEKVEQMSPEDRERWKQKMEGRCGSKWGKASKNEPEPDQPGDPFGADQVAS